MTSRVTFLAVLREIREHAAVGHVVPVDRDEERAFRAVGVDVWGAVAALAERIQAEIRFGFCLSALATGWLMLVLGTSTHATISWDKLSHSIPRGSSCSLSSDTAPSSDCVISALSLSSAAIQVHSAATASAASTRPRPSAIFFSFFIYALSDKEGGPQSKLA